MVKWIVMLVCALTLAACGSMQNTASSGSSGNSGQNYASGSSDVVGVLPGAWGAGTFGNSGP